MMVSPRLAEAFRATRPGWWGILALSAMLNVLALTGSIYLMLVYDRVLPSSSAVTLLSLLAIVALLYAFNAAGDFMRLRLLSSVAAMLDRKLAPTLHRLELRSALQRSESGPHSEPLRDLDRVRAYLSGLGPAAILDLPWVALFLVVLFLMHWLLGLATLVGAIALAAWAWRAEGSSRSTMPALIEAVQDKRILDTRIMRSGETIRGLGLERRMIGLALASHRAFVGLQGENATRSARYGAVSRAGRMFLQAAVLSVGALLVIDGRASVGIIFASSILAGRALAPIEQATANWSNMVAARQAWARLDEQLALAHDEALPSVELPPAASRLSVEDLAVVPPAASSPVLSRVSFALEAGDVLATVGPSGAGKSSLCKALCNAWPAARGAIRLDGAEFGKWDPEMLGANIGYLPQSVDLFAGTVAQNIARFDPAATSEGIIGAAVAAGVHDYILGLPDGYDSAIGEGGVRLSGGQRQRLGLARALYGEPFLLVLDEPTSNLDPAGEDAFLRAIKGVRERKGIVVMATHQPSLVRAADAVLILRGGVQHAFGPRDEVIAQVAGTAKATDASYRFMQGGGA